MGSPIDQTPIGGGRYPANMASSKKAEYMAYMDQSGGRQMLSKAIVALSKASLADSSVKPAVFLRDFFAGGKAGAGSTSADLSADDKERVSAYMKSSGANDLLTKALVALHDNADRPKNPGAFFSTYFTSEAPPPKPSPKKEPSGKDLKEKTPSATQAYGSEVTMSSLKLVWRYLRATRSGLRNGFRERARG